MLGKKLIDFLSPNNFHACNTFFNHKLAHFTTFTSNLTNPTRINPYRSQIDFILVHTNWKTCNTNARSHAGTIANSDHRLVTAQFKIIWTKIFKTPINNKNIIATHLSEKDNPEKYKNYINKHIEEISKSNSNQNKWNTIFKICIEASENLKPPKAKCNNKKDNNEEIEELSTYQKDLRLLIEKQTNREKKKKLKADRNYALHSIQRIIKRNKENKFLNTIK